MQPGQLLATWEASLARQSYFFARVRAYPRRRPAAMPRLIGEFGFSVVGACNYPRPFPSSLPPNAIWPAAAASRYHALALHPRCRSSATGAERLRR